MRSKGLYRVTMETEVDPNAVEEKIKWNNRRDEAYGLSCVSIFRDLLFHLDGLSSPDKVWRNFKLYLGRQINLGVINWRSS